ncbi:MAG: hypothetical protein GH142_00440 [Dehalococcoidia bacterium]|nr:hypothetical protein [Dehalococcoidia bacterium]
MGSKGGVCSITLVSIFDTALLPMGFTSATGHPGGLALMANPYNAVWDRDIDKQKG